MYKEQDMETKRSPRIENGVIKWYEGNAFYINFSISNEATGQAISLMDGDCIVVEFKDRSDRVVAVYEVQQAVAGKFPVHIDRNVTKRFKVGKYHYDIELHRNGGDTIQTLCKCGKAEVEGCHDK